MDIEKRVAVYAVMNGNRKKLTPRQRRRIRRMLNHSLAPFGRKAVS